MMSKDGWQTRNVRYERIHKAGKEEFRQFLNSGEVQNNQIVGDFMAGYGAVSRELSNLAQEQGLELQIVLADKFPEQLYRSNAEIPHMRNVTLRRLICDVQRLPFNDRSFHRIFVKLGLHELPSYAQQTAVNEIYRVLKPEGILSVWDLISANVTQQKFIQDVARKKDELAGFKDLVRDRYFFRQDELEQMTSRAGFKQTQFCHEFINTVETCRRLDSEFKGDAGKLNEWNEYIRKR